MNSLRNKLNELRIYIFKNYWIFVKFCSSNLHKMLTSH